MATDFDTALKRLQTTGICYCEWCNADTRHFATMGLGLPACEVCYGLAGWIVFGDEPQDRSKRRDLRVVRNAIVESATLRKRKL